MSVLWTDVISPAELTGYARASLAAYEKNKGTLARWLPNRDVADIVVRFVAGSSGLIPVANFRAYDAEPEVGKREGGRRVVLELPALGQNLPVSEYEQLRSRRGAANVGEEQILSTITKVMDQIVQSVADSIEYLRGVVLVTGKATIDQDRYQSDDDFGRSASHTLTAGTLWSSATSVSRLSYLQTIVDTYTDTNGAPPGAIVASTRVMRSMGQGDEFQTQLVTGTRPASEQEVQNTVLGHGLPPIFKYDRRVSINGTSTRVLRDDTLLLLPEPVDPNDWQGTDLGATFWGQTLTSDDPDWAIEDSQQPGIVAGVYRNPKPPMGIEVISDAIGLPVLANANRSLAATVL